MREAQLYRIQTGRGVGDAASPNPLSGVGALGSASPLGPTGSGRRTHPILGLPKPTLRDTETWSLQALQLRWGRTSKGWWFLVPRDARAGCDFNLL